MEFHYFQIPNILFGILCFAEQWSQPTRSSSCYKVLAVANWLFCSFCTFWTKSILVRVHFIWTALYLKKSRWWNQHVLYCVSLPVALLACFDVTWHHNVIYSYIWLMKKKELDHAEKMLPWLCLKRGGTTCKHPGSCLGGWPQLEDLPCSVLNG